MHIIAAWNGGRGRRANPPGLPLAAAILLFTGGAGILFAHERQDMAIQRRNREIVDLAECSCPIE
jgi:hypothetical protein